MHVWHGIASEIRDQSDHACHVLKRITFQIIELTMMNSKSKVPDLIFAYLNSSEQIPTTDVTIFCSDGALPCHRLVLASLSKMFYSILIEHNFDEKVTIILPEFKAVEVQTFLESLFTERKVNAHNSLNDLFGVENLNKDENSLLLKTEHIENECEDTCAKDEVEVDQTSSENCDSCFSNKEFDGVKNESNEMVTISIINSKEEKRKSDENSEKKYVVFRDEDNQKKYKCNMCEYSTLQPSHIRRHVNTVHMHGMDTFTCQHCGKIFRQKSSYVTHIQVHEERRQAYEKKCLENGLLEQIIVDGVCCFKCKQCEYSSPRFSIANRHTKRHNKKATKVDREFKTCEVCGILVENSSVLKVHILRTHGILEKTVKQKTIPNDCSKCRKCKMLLKPDDIHNHVCQKNIKCPECGKMFYNCQERANHKLEEHSEPQSCEICGKTFQTLKKLTSHLETHAEKVECPQCGLKVKHLQRHIDQKHVQDKRFKCSQCGKGFIQADLLKRHIDCIHLNARRYQCRYCDFRFNDSSNRNAHERKKHLTKTGKELAI